MTIYQAVIDAREQAREELKKLRFNMIKRAEEKTKKRLNDAKRNGSQD